MDLLDIYAVIALDTSEYERGVEGATKKSTKLQTAFKQNAQVSETLKNKLNVLASQHEKAQKEVDLLTTAFNKSAKEKGVDSKETQQLAQKLKDAEDNVVSIQKEMDDLTVTTEETGESFEISGGKISGFADKLKHGLATAAKVGAVALGAATAAVGALTKASIEGYAAQEQLIGGVKTLFGTEAGSAAEYAASVGKSVEDVQGEYDALIRAQDTVFANASEAYKTAGLTVNAYMETVTGFSAALIQSLGGDTEKAASVADTAITDMADNANKMGTAMESIQNAYQGFAKQNFTINLMSAV